jgi:hypothetical protein
MEKIRELLAPAKFGEIACLFTWRAPRHLVAGILSAITLMTPAGASAQFDDVLRNVMQNMLQVPQTANRAYPQFRQPAYPYGAGVPAPAVSVPGTIAEIQRMLDDLGYNAGPADGTWGRKARRRLATLRATMVCRRARSQPGRSTPCAAYGTSAIALRHPCRQVWTKAFPDRALTVPAPSLPLQEQFAGTRRLRNSTPKWPPPMS